MKTLRNKFVAGYKNVGQYVGAAFAAPTKVQGQFMLFGLGVLILTVGIMHGAEAQEFGGFGGGDSGAAENTDLGNYNDVRIAEAVNRIFAYLEGSFGALIMVSAGLGAIISSAFGQYRAALGLLVVAVGAFILRSLVSTFFNDIAIR